MKQDKGKNINVVSFAIFQSVLMAYAGLLAGAIYSFGGLLHDALVSTGLITSSSTPGLSYGTALAFLALLGMPLIFAGTGFILGLVEAVLYNALSGVFGTIDFKRRSEK